MCKVLTAVASLTAVAVATLLGIWAVRRTFPATLSTPIFDPPDPLMTGQWETVVPKELGMHSVHTVLLPSGKVLIAPESGWHNFQNGTEVYPKKETYRDTEWPAVNKGLFNRAEDPFKNSKKETYDS